MKRYQILARSKRGEPWHFLAHGARFEEQEAHAMRDSVASRGELVRLIRV